MLEFLLACTLLSPVILPILIWLFVIRPYCRRHGQGYTPGANAGITMFVDWQMANEIAKRRGDRLYLKISRVFVIWILLLFAAWILQVAFF